MAEGALNAILLDRPYPFPIGKSLAELAGLDGSNNYTASDLFDLTSDDDQFTGMGEATDGVPHQAVIQYGSSTSRQIFERLELRVTLGANGIEIKIWHQYPENQVWQLDSMSPIVADMDVGSPFFMSGISHRDKRNGYFNYDSKGYPVPHDRIWKAKREDPALPPIRRKTIHTKRGECPEREASRWYDPWVYQPSSWRCGDNRKDRRKGENKYQRNPDFEYTEDAQLVWRKYSTEEIQAYLDQCPRKYVLWIQRDLSQFNHRFQSRTGKSSVKKDRHCRWKECPAEGKPVLGMYRIAFDEFPTQTSQGIKDPFKVAMIMHLWCFEQIFDPIIYHRNGRLHLDTRTFATPSSDVSDKRGRRPHPDNLGRAENMNPFSIRIGNGKRSSNKERVPEAAYYPWLYRHLTSAPATDLPRTHDDSLGYAFTLWQLEKETNSKLELRRNRHGLLRPPERDGRPESERFFGADSTHHFGSLKGWKAAQKPTTRRKKAKSTTQCREIGPRDNEESPDEDNAPPQPRGKKKRRSDASELGEGVDERPRKRARKDKEP